MSDPVIRDGDKESHGPPNVGLLTIQPSDAAASPRIFNFILLPVSMDEIKVWNSGQEILTTEIRSTRRRTWPSATSSITNPTWIGPGLNTDLRVEKTATHRLRHDPTCTIMGI
jgi:hypothetical protein